MSSPMKLAALALISTAAAAPHYSHGRFHRPSGFPGTGVEPTASFPTAVYPSGGFGRHQNSTAVLPTVTGAYGEGHPQVPDDETTTLVETQFSTHTITSTIYATRPGEGPAGGPSNAEVADVVKPTGAEGCGPATITVTATNQVTVTVGGGQAPSSHAEAAESTSEGIYSILPIHTGAPGNPVEGNVANRPSHPAASNPAPSSVAESHAVSSSTPQPSSNPSNPAPGHSGGKRGLAYNDLSLCQAFGSGGGFSFAYNWGSAENGDLPEGVKFAPMMHRPALQTADKWLEDVAAAVKKGSDVVMGFNEPDHAEQANMSPEEACKQWTSYMEPIVSAHPEVTILGPSVTNGPAPMGLDWLSRFQKGCPDATWHAANIHFYDIYEKDATVERFTAQVEKAAKEFGKPVWVTEFGLNPGSASSEQAADFLKGAMQYMDGSDSVQGYSYFMVGTGENQLNGGNGLSSIGEVYASA